MGLFGQVTGQPIYQLLGGASRDKVRVYNTCAGYQYVRAKPVQGTANFGLPAKVDKKNRPYEDLMAFKTDAGELAKSLLDMGITGMKIWPFDEAAEASNGSYISNADLKKAMRPFEQIRKAVGDKMDIHVEFHSMWNLPTAIRIAEALEQFDPFWYEDPIKMNNIDAVADYAHRTNVWVTASETLGTRWGFRELFEKQAVSVCMLDVGWTGGLSESKKIATMAEAYQLPVAPHDCTGPILLTASVHLSMNCPNTLVQEMVRAFYYDWYGKLVTELPPVKNGYITAPKGPGLGTKLQPSVLKRKDATRRISQTREVNPNNQISPRRHEGHEEDTKKTNEWEDLAWVGQSGLATDNQFVAMPATIFPIHTIQHLTSVLLRVLRVFVVRSKLA